MSYAEYDYLKNGFSSSGSKIPDIPIVRVLLSVKGREFGIQGPVLVDTGFDRGVYANYAIASYLEGCEPVSREALEAPGHLIDCEVFTMECSLLDSVTSEPVVDLGEVQVHVPTDPNDLTDEVLIGRNVLNSLEMILNGEKLKTRSLPQP